MAWVSSTTVGSGPRISQAAPDPTPQFFELALEEVDEGGAFDSIPLPDDGLNTFSDLSPTTANPISSTNWLLGLTDGLDWNDVQASGSHFCGINSSPGSDTDNTAARKGTFHRKQFIQATCFRAASYNPAQVHEIELLLHCSITAHNITTYEVLLNSGGGFEINRWDGALDNVFFGLSITNHNGGPTNPANGDVFRFEDDGAGNFSLYQNTVLVATFSDTTWTGGAPGHAYFWRPSGSITPTSFGWTAMTGGEW